MIQFYHEVKSSIVVMFKDDVLCRFPTMTPVKNFTVSLNKLPDMFNIILNDINDTFSDSIKYSSFSDGDLYVNVNNDSHIYIDDIGISIKAYVKRDVYINLVDYDKDYFIESI